MNFSCINVVCESVNRLIVIAIVYYIVNKVYAVNFVMVLVIPRGTGINVVVEHSIPNTCEIHQATQHPNSYFGVLK